MNALLHATHRQLEEKGFRELFAKGWETLSCEKKVAFAATTVFSASYAGGAFLFGGLAFKEAIKERLAGKSSPIIGHFSEWSMLGTFALILYAQLPYDIAQRAKKELICNVFQAALSDPNRSNDEKCKLYEERWRLLQANAQIRCFFHPPFPTNNVTLNGNDVMSLDYALQGDYADLKKTLDASSWRLALEGWGHAQIPVITKRALYTFAFLAAALVSIYGIGIVDSGGQAWDDYRKGAIPSIGGHSLEWLAEIGGLGSLFYKLFSELATVGQAVRLSQSVHAKVKALQQGDPKAGRLEEVLADTFDAFPTAYFFKVPHSLRFVKNEPVVVQEGDVQEV